MSALLDALGYVGDALDKPGRAVRGLLAGRPDEVGAFVPFSDSMGLTDQSRAVSGQDLAKSWGLDTGSELGNTAVGFGVDMLTDPTTYLGAGIARKLAQGGFRGAQAAAAGDELAEAGGMGLKGLRDRFGMVFDDGTDNVRVLGKHPGQEVVDAAVQRARGDLAPRGSYSFSRNAGFVGPGSYQRDITRRHETMHGLVDQARKAGDASSLGLVGRVAARLPAWGDETASPFMRSLGLIGDEAAAHMAEGRGMLEQLGRGARFFMDPGKVGFYGKQIEERSPLAAALYRNAQYTPYAIGGAGLLGGAAVAGQM